MTTQQIITGDCLEVMKTFEDNQFDLVLTDPPYGMDYLSSRRKDKHEKIENDVTVEEWLLPVCKQSFRVLKPDSHAYFFCNDYAISDFRKALQSVGFTVKRTLVWVKNNHTSGDLEGDYANKTEFVVFAHKGRRLLNGKRDTNVLTGKRALSNVHPTEKPIDLMQKLILKSSNEYDTILDPFMGSGTTLLAAKALKRNAVGIEISEKYCKIAEDRLKAMPTPML